MVNTVLFGAGAGLVALAWMQSIREKDTAAEILNSALSLQEPLLLITVAILLGGVFHSFTILYPALLESREEKQRALSEVDDFKDQAYRDPLTELHNRRYFDEIFDAYFTEFGQVSTPFGLLVLDVDHFKRINDNYGHAAGDEVLKKIASSARRLTRENDVIARIGGEEFAVLIAYVNERQLMTVADRFRKTIEALEVDCSPEIIRPTISMGAVLSTHFDSTDKMMRAADECLYKAKNSGRNRVISRLKMAVA